MNLFHGASLPGQPEKHLLQIALLQTCRSPQVAGRPQCHQPSPVDDPDPVAEVFRDLQGVGGHEDRRPLAGQLPEEVLDHP